MLSHEDNQRITRVGPGTPMGTLMRRYWQPAALSAELPEPDGPPIRVRLLGEDLVAFRDSDGVVALVDAFCPHRRAPMFFGRNEECGLRCVYHGWKFDPHGVCVDMPSDPPDSLFKTKVRITAYPTHEAGGIVWAYLGPETLRPAPPDYELVRAPQTHRWVSKTYEECNWLQALEGGVDSSHVTFLHNMNITDGAWLHAVAPEIEFERAPYGHYGVAIHRRPDAQFVRSFHYVMPAQTIRARSTGPHGGPAEVPHLTGHIWVPIDDETCWIYNWLCAYVAEIPLTPAFALAREAEQGRGPDDLAPGYRLKANRANEYFLDREVQRTRTFSGIPGINTQDYAIQEGMGAIVDRSKEHLAVSDRVIILTRQLLLEAVTAAERGEPVRGADPATYAKLRAADDVLPPDAAWRDALAKKMIARF
jgi:phenylpropionate dioxygenase-like ring-hydroxylating dioxygenase large terminal subunit